MYSNIFDKYTVLSILLDIEDDDGWELVVSASRYLETLYEDDSDIYYKLDSLKRSINPDIASEAYYRLGRIEFYNINSSEEEQVAIKLDKARQYFLNATQIEIGMMHCFTTI